MSGGGDYDHVQTYKNVTGTDPIYKLDYLDIDSDKDEDGIYLQTGEVKLEEEEAGNYDVEITDRFGQRKQLALTVKDTTLALSEYEVNMSGYKDYLVEKYQSYGDIQSVAPSDDKVSAQLVELKDGSQAVYIKMNKPGRSIITVTDENPHFTQPTDGSKPKSKAIRTINVYSHERYKDIATDEVVEEVVEEETTSGKIRYIRDWLHGSDLTTTNVWTEIQALDKYGVNKALNAQVTTDYTGTPTGTSSSITDGKATGNRFGKSYANSYNNVTVDLGDIYNISKVKVWHYNDGRIMNKTKTEVSPDGVNWTTLFDSAVSGTYVEPKDGSGREYRVDDEKLSEEIEFTKKEVDDELRGMLLELGLQGSDLENLATHYEKESGVEINSTLFYTGEYSEKKYQELWEEYSNSLNDYAIPILKKKFGNQFDEENMRYTLDKIVGLKRDELYLSIKSDHAIDNEDKMKSTQLKLSKLIAHEQWRNKKLSGYSHSTKSRFLVSYAEAYYITYNKASTIYWQENIEEKEEYDRMMEEFYIDLAWDISGFKDISTAMADVAISWQGIIQEDKELIALGGDNLEKDLLLLGAAVSPSRKFRKMLGVKKKIERLKLFLKLKKVTGFKDASNHYYKHVVQRKEFNYATVREYEKSAIDFMKNKEGDDFLVWKRTRDGSILKVNEKTGTLGIMDKHGNITTFYKSDQFLKNPNKFINDN